MSLFRNRDSKMGGNYKTVTTYQPKSINHSSDDERNPLETATQIIINENSIRDYDVWPRILNLGKLPYYKLGLI